MNEIKPPLAQIELVVGDITQQADADIIVNAANAQLESGGGVAGAIHRAAGPDLAEACRPLAPIRPGKAVISPAFRLPNSYVIHCLGPVYGRDEPSDTLLANCYRNALLLADKQQVKSIAFPAISTGIFGFPKEKAAEIALRTIKSSIPSLQTIRTIRMVLFDQADLTIFEGKLAQIIE
ncbi:O-acetyl-ADP-ribose deacetylase (regulator of RNase III), contains Macro domain [Cyclobacterium xiamenense]|uniref:O-acetyl-ADP-ribose deacetylase (Regulator of RNase III), contains Macro domain n=1 Tax=Cyclobacterium xiamenense TaxID=1297121 RepID=A0A1H6VZF7_9BACT|nr:macro domain-containing protein [Cyclobacterium xiamenense]SEJ05415.1 O-acetyl-ADP-ribose deacetylase (regulator of RNase III), contains Macro domain [Cyclobacterium xiamenense]